MDYRVVFDVTNAASDPTKPNPSLDAVARFLNLLAAEDVQPALGHIVAVVHGPATPSVVINGAYARKTGRPANPNLPLIERLQAAGVIVAVCGQAMHRNGIAASELAPGVRIDVSTLTALVNLQLCGWALVPS